MKNCIIILFLITLIPFYLISQNDSINVVDHNGLKQGKWKEAHPDKDIEYVFVNYIDNIKNGEFTAYHPDNTIAIQGCYNNGKLHGEHKTFFESGKLFIHTQYINDTLSGTYTKYYDNGNMVFEHGVQKNVPHGYYKMYYENGQLLFEGNYINGEKTGNWKSITIDDFMKVRDKVISDVKAHYGKK